MSPYRRPGGRSTRHHRRPSPAHIPPRVGAQHLDARTHRCIHSRSGHATTDVRRQRPDHHARRA